MGWELSSPGLFQIINSTDQVNGNDGYSLIIYPDVTVAIVDSVLDGWGQDNDVTNDEWAILTLHPVPGGDSLLIINRSTLSFISGFNVTSLITNSNGTVLIESSTVDRLVQNEPINFPGTGCDNDSSISLVNTSLPEFSIHCAELRQSWFVRARSTDLASNPVEGSTLNAYLQNGSIAWTQSTGSDGFTAFQPVLTTTIGPGNSITNLSNITVEAQKAGFTTVSSVNTVTQSTTVTLSFLELLSQILSSSVVQLTAIPLGILLLLEILKSINGMRSMISHLQFYVVLLTMTGIAILVFLRFVG